jgi:hypothetical protein
MSELTDQAREEAEACKQVGGFGETVLVLELLADRIEELEAKTARSLPDDAKSLSYYIDGLADLEVLRGTPEGPWLDDIHRAAAILRGDQ